MASRTGFTSVFLLRSARRLQKWNLGGMGTLTTTNARNFSETTTMQSADKIEVNVQNGVRNIVINRPEAKNALSYEMMDKLGSTFFESNTDPETKIITITGMGDFFTSGNDLNNWRGISIPEIQAKSRKYVLNQFMYGVIDCKKPVIAMVNGGAIGAGATILPHCDLVLASDKAFFYTPFPLLGIVPEFCSSYTFPKLMGLVKANDMLLFGNKLSAHDALQCGLVSKMFPHDAFAGACQKLIGEYLKIPLEPLLQSKEIVRGPEREKLRHLCAYEMDFVIRATETPLMKANMEKFFSRKK